MQLWGTPSVLQASAVSVNPMRVIRPIHPVLLPARLPARLPALVLLITTVACASAPMGRGASEGDDVGGTDDDGSADADGDDGSETLSATGSGLTEDSGDSAGADVSATAGESQPTQPSASDSDAESSSTESDSTESDATESDSTESDSTGSSGEDTATGESTTDAGDTETPADVDLSGYTIIQTDSAREFVIPDGTSVPPGTAIVIGRGASQATFENFWGTSWGDEVVYFEGADAFPTINGDETYSLLAPDLSVVDGATPALGVGTSMARTNAGIDASNDAAWETVLLPNSDSTPGVTNAQGGVSGQPYISEYADTIGGGNFDFEFVEIHVPG